MSGSIRERAPGTWELRVSTGRDPLTGKYPQVTRTFRGNKTAARRALAALANEVAEGRHTGSDGLARVLFDRWWAQARTNYAETTARSWDGYIANRILPGLGALRLKRIGPDDLDAFYAALLADGMAPGAVRVVHSICNLAFDQAVRWKWLAGNPVRLARPPRVPRAEISPPAPAEVMRLVAAADTTDPELATLLRLAVATGARRGELCGLRWSNLSITNRTLVIARSVFTRKGVDPGEKDTKTHAARTLSLDSKTVEVLEVHRARMEERAAIAGTQLRDDAYIFAADVDGGRPWAPDRVSGAWRRLVVRSDAGHIRFHDLRHMHGTRLLDAGIPVRTVSGRLGHANASTTLDVYAAWVPARDRDAADVIGREME